MRFGFFKLTCKRKELFFYDNIPTQTNLANQNIRFASGNNIKMCLAVCKLSTFVVEYNVLNDMK